MSEGLIEDTVFARLLKTMTWSKLELLMIKASAEKLLHSTVKKLC